MNTLKNSKTGRAIICVSILLVLVFASFVVCVAMRGEPEDEGSAPPDSGISAQAPPAEISPPPEESPIADGSDEQSSAMPETGETTPSEPSAEPNIPSDESAAPETPAPSEDESSGELESDSEENEPINEQAAAQDKCTISFLGNCILGQQYITDAFFTDFPTHLLDDDLTLCCLGGCFAEPDAAQISTPYAVSSEYAQIIRASGIDAVNLANSYTSSASEAEYAATAASLEANSIAYIEDWSDCVFVSNSGVKIGLYASDGYVGSNIKQSIAAMREAGAELIVACFTWDADNLDYYYENQNYGAHYAADCGADIVFGQGADALESIERYGDSIIIYNLGTLINSAFISESSETAIVQLVFERDENNAFQLSETSYIPYLSGAAGNHPKKLDPGTEEYYSVLSKLVIQTFEPGDEE